MITRRILPALFVALSLAGLLQSRGVAGARGKQNSNSKQAQVKATLEGSALSERTMLQIDHQLKDRPDDLILRSQLLGYYVAHKEPAIRRARLQHIIWLIRYAPSAWVTGSSFVLLTPDDGDAAISLAQRLWVQQTQTHPKNADVLGNAAVFFSTRDASAAERLYKKAQALEPTEGRWAGELGRLLYRRSLDQKGADRKQIAQEALTQFEAWDRYARAEEKSGDNSALADMAMAAYEAEAFDKARTYAGRLLDIAHDPTAGNSVHHGNVVLGRLALHDGDTAKASAYLLASGHTPGSPQLESLGPNMTLAKELLEKGERQVVLDYFQLCSKFWNDPALKQWTMQVKNGEIPKFGPNLFY